MSMRDSIKLEKILGARNGNVLKIHGVEATILVVRVVVVIIIIIIIIVRGRGAVVIIPKGITSVIITVRIIKGIVLRRTQDYTRVIGIVLLTDFYLIYEYLLC